MKLRSFLRDKIVYLLFCLLSVALILSLLLIFDSNHVLITLVVIILITSFLIPLLYEFIKKVTFYNYFRKTLDNLDKKYLITEMINESNFLDGKLMLDYLYDIDKSMHEQINNYKYISTELKEYIALWCHEIKTPIATSKLIIDNNENDITKSILEEIDSIENYVEQVLFYSRSDAVEKDYLIAKINLEEVIDNVIKRNKKVLINKKIKIDIDKLPFVNSDQKWIEFIINQIIINSIKYSKNKNAVIKISSIDNINNKTLIIKDNGIGIAPEEIDRVFDKGFTGSNGRKKYNSTGIGLYLCKKLIMRLGHEIQIESCLDEYTIVKLIFPNNSMTDDIR